MPDGSPVVLFHVHSSPKEVHIDLPQFSRWPWVTDPDLGSCRCCQMVLTVIIKMICGRGRWPIDTSENYGGFHVHFFRRRVYLKAILQVYSLLFSLHHINRESFDTLHWNLRKNSLYVASVLPQFTPKVFAFHSWYKLSNMKLANLKGSWSYMHKGFTTPSSNFPIEYHNKQFYMAPSKCYFFKELLENLN